MPQAYRGINRYRTHLKAGKTITSKIAELEGVIGVLGTGSIGRRFGDRFSDLDMTVYAESAAVRRLSRSIAVGWLSYKGVSFGVPVESHDRALKAGVPSEFWTQVQRWHHQNSQILFDPEGQFKNLLQEKLIYSDEERQRLVNLYQDEVHEHLVFFPEMWAEGGSLYNVLDALTRAVRYVLLWIYARRGVFEPYMAKWPFYHLELKTVPEHVHLITLTRVYTDRIGSLKAAFGYRKELLNLCDQIGLAWEVNSTEEALERCANNWKATPEETKRLLSW